VTVQHYESSVLTRIYLHPFTASIYMYAATEPHYHTTLRFVQLAINPLTPTVAIRVQL